MRKPLTVVFNAVRLALPLCLLGFAAAAETQAKPAALPGGASSLRETYGDWRVACTQPKGETRCVLSQQQVDGKTHRRVLAVELAARAADKVDGTLILPFGLALGQGVALRIDSGPFGPTLGFRTCVPAGCLVTVAFDAKLVDALRRGNTIKVKAVADGGKAVSFTIPLKGFSAALDRAIALTK